jgi:hypothetical protein
MLNDKIIATAKLFNGKRVVIVPMKTSVNWRYMTASEIKNNTFEIFKNHVWMNSPILETVDGGRRLLFTVIEGTPIALNRYYE